MNIKRLMISIAGMGIFYSSHIQAKGDCSFLLSRAREETFQEPTTTQKFEAYLYRLLNEKIIPIKALKVFAKNLKEGKIINPISEEAANIDFGAHFHKDGLQAHIEHHKEQGTLDVDELKVWTTKEIAEREVTRKNRNVVRRKTQELPGNDNQNFWEGGWWKKATRGDLRHIDPNAKEILNYNYPNGVVKSNVTYIIHSATKRASIKTFKIFLELHRQNIILDARTDNGTTSLMIAASDGDIEKVELLIKEKVDINAETNDGVTVLMHASSSAAYQQGNAEVIKILIKAGVNINAKANGFYGWTALRFAKERLRHLATNDIKRKRLKKVIKILKEHGAE